MENEEDFLRAAAILKDLDNQLSGYSESSLLKAQAEAKKEVEVYYEKCIKAIQSRKEVLLREVESRFQHKRKQSEAKEKEVKTTLETCRKLLLAGVAVYNKGKREEATNLWKSLSEFSPKNGETDQIRVVFTDTLLAYISASGAFAGGIWDSTKQDTPSNTDGPRLSKSSSTDGPRLSKSSSTDASKLNRSSQMDTPKIPKSSSSDKSPSLDVPKLNTSTNVDKSQSIEPTKLNKSANVETPKLNKSANIDNKTEKDRPVEPLKLDKSANIDSKPPSETRKLNKSSTLDSKPTSIDTKVANEPQKMSKSPSAEPQRPSKSSNVEPSSRLSKTSSTDTTKSSKTVPTESPRLGKTMENLVLDKPPSTESTKLGKHSLTDNLRVSTDYSKEKPTQVDSPRGSKVAASMNKVTTLTELNYGLEGRIASNAQLRHPNGICFNPHDKSLYVCDNGHVVFRVTPSGEPKIFAKRGDGQLQNPMGITYYIKDCCFFVTSQLQHSIKMINSAGIVTVVAGCGKEGWQDGVGPKTAFSHPVGITVDQLTGDLYVSDFGNHVIRKISPQGVVSTLAGTAGKKGYADGVGKTAVFNCPSDLCFNDKDQSLVVCDVNNNRIRRVALNGEVSTIGEITRPSSLAIASDGSFLVSSQYENKIFRLFKGASGYKIETLAGSGRKGGDDGNGAECSFGGISGIALDDKTNICYVAEHEFSRIRKITLQF